MSNPRKRADLSNPEWSTINRRIEWIIRTRFDDNRSQLAKALGFSRTLLTNVSREESPKNPGRRLLDAIVTKLFVDRKWLLTGVGQPFLSDGSAFLNRGIPVTNVLLPGPPLDHQAMITGEWIVVPEVVSSPSTYWLFLKSSQPIVRSPAFGFHSGDQLLMETDPSKFRKESSLWEDLCVVRYGTELRMAKLSFYSAEENEGDARLEAEFPEPVQTEQSVLEHVYRHHPDGLVTHVQRSLRDGQRLGSEQAPPAVRYENIVSVWLKILRRPAG